MEVLFTCSAAPAHIYLNLKSNKVPAKDECLESQKVQTSRMVRRHLNSEKLARFALGTQLMELAL